MINKIKSLIRQKNRAQWRAFVFEKCTDARIWAQENGERAAVLSLILGMVIVLAFKIFIVVIALLIIAGYIVFFTANPE